MKPSDTYSYLANRHFLPDFSSLLKGYQPLLGWEAYGLYHYFWSFYDNGRGRYPISQILNQLRMGTQTFERALDRLLALQLLDLYQEEQGYKLALCPPLSLDEFLRHSLYRSLLIKEIGEAAVDLLEAEQLFSGEKWTKSFSEVFDVAGNERPLPASAPLFDLEAFEHLMARDKLRFQNKNEEVIALHHFAERQQLSVVDLYQVAKETAIDRVLSISRMDQAFRTKKEPTGSFTPQEQALIRESKQKTALEFLTLLKQGKNASLLFSERKCLQDLAQLGLLDEVINVLVLYTFNRADSANLNETYAMKVGNDFSYRGISSAEMAVEALREGHRKPRARVSKGAATTGKTNIPEWSNPDYRNETTPEKQAALEEEKRRLLARLNKGED